MQTWKLKYHYLCYLPSIYQIYSEILHINLVVADSEFPRRISPKGKRQPIMWPIFSWRIHANETNLVEMRVRHKIYDEDHKGGGHVFIITPNSCAKNPWLFCYLLKQHFLV